MVGMLVHQLLTLTTDHIGIVLKVVTVEVSLVTDNNVISELEQFNSTVVSVVLSSTSPEDITIDLATFLIILLIILFSVLTPDSLV